jgi:hypothetical protein
MDRGVQEADTQFDAWGVAPDAPRSVRAFQNLAGQLLLFGSECAGPQMPKVGRRYRDSSMDQATVNPLCLSPQCGFASTEEGNILSDAGQWKKLGRVVEVAKATWGEV